MQIHRLRKRHHLTQAKLAELAGVSQQHVAKLEAGRLDPKLSTLKKFAAAFHCDVSELFLSREEFLRAIHRVVDEHQFDLEELMAKRNFAYLTRQCHLDEFIPPHHHFWGEVEVSRSNKLRFKKRKKR